MSTIEAIILGLVQGLTEFLPVSSSGHLEIGSALLNTATEDNLLFTIVLHGATALSTIVVFRKDIGKIIGDIFKFEWNESLSFGLKIILSIIPTMIVGLLFEEQINSFFGGKIVFVGSMLIVTSLLLGFTFYAKKQEGEVSFKKAFIIGLAQACAILPGISRSGSTIATGLLLGVKKEEATRFSFLMVLIPILGAAFLKALEFIKDPSVASGISISALSGGFLAAFIGGLVACTW
ncbi:undecaprenyl-diphosphate phosphatase, partial [Xanthovirga aplysinae]|uniref:undecaprenyl-diphosphate phosphatase n=1 Tax=Xanthovirga aplysinae TaxID=2529853 RepID=UPI0012BD1E6D